jgi:hypothetical protein
MGARRFTFALRGQLALVQRCQSDKGRHSFMTGQPTGSGNVFLDCKATESLLVERAARTVGERESLRQRAGAADRALLEGHQHRVGRRQHRVLELRGSFLVQKPPTAQNYSFGHLGVNAVVFNIPLQDPSKENGHLESLDRHVTPRSLYLAQLRERLGDTAGRQVATAVQLA